MAKSLFPTATLLVLVLLFVFPPTTTAAEDTVVLDVDGNPVESNYPYYIISFHGFNRGLIHIPRKIENCPILNVGLSPINNNPGRYHMFHPKNSTQKLITPSTDLQIFSEPVIPRPFLYCNQPTGWQVVYDRPTATGLVTLGGDKKSSNFFKIKAVRSGVAYKIELSCPTHVSSTSCGHFGFLPENGQLFLAMTQIPGLFGFKKFPLPQYY